MRWLPNIITLGALITGLIAVGMVLSHHWHLAVFTMFIAMLLDATDGLVARLLSVSSKFGATLDSLSDFLNFGIVPTGVLYMWVLQEIGMFGCLAAITFSTACAIRLARFNALSEINKPSWHHSFFTGLPSPAGAFTVLLPFYLHNIMHFPLNEVVASAIAVYIIFIALLMVSTIPVFAINKIDSSGRITAILALITLPILIATATNYPFHFLVVLVVFYMLICIPVGYTSFQQFSKRDTNQRSNKSITAINTYKQ